MVAKYKSTSSTFKILKSGWGIWIQISGESIPSESQNHQFEIELTNRRLAESELTYLRNGFQWVTPILAKQGITKRTITITEIKLIPTDYQAEGLFYAIAFWLAEHFEFEMPIFKCEFDRANNKYLFPDLNAG